MTDEELQQELDKDVQKLIKRHGLAAVRFHVWAVPAPHPRQSLSVVEPDARAMTERQLNAEREAYIKELVGIVERDATGTGTGTGTPTEMIDIVEGIDPGITVDEIMYALFGELMPFGVVDAT